MTSTEMLLRCLWSLVRVDSGVCAGRLYFVLMLTMDSDVCAGRLCFVLMLTDGTETDRDGLWRK